MTQNKQARLNQIRDSIVDSNVCPDLAAQATQLVFGEGNPDAEVVFIGEAPGKNEDLQGLPFVGAAGKLLSEMLEKIDMKREEIYITNIVKYRPPGNRDPLPEEKKAFWPFLVSQLNVIQPKLVVTLGRHGMEYFMPSQKISAVHGQPKRIRWNTQEPGSQEGRAGDQSADGMQGEREKRTEPYNNTVKGVSQGSTQQSAVMHSRLTSSDGKRDVQTMVILPLFHPAAALYNGGMRQTLIDDFARIPLIISKIQ